MMLFFVNDPYGLKLILLLACIIWAKPFAFLEHTDCMGIVSIRSVHKELVAGNLRVVEIKGMPMLREFNFVQLQGQEGGLSQVFMRFAGHHSKSL